MEFFLDDLIAATDNPLLLHLTHFLKEILHGVHSIFPPPNVTKNQGKEQISQKN